MGESAQTGFRDWLVTIVGIVLLIAGLLALAFPVFLSEYNQFGVQINCGNGYFSRLAQASAEDRTGDCMSAIMQRRMWAIPIACLGILVLFRELAVWIRLSVARAGSGASRYWSERPDQALHEAAVLDRRERTYGGSSGPSPNTTL